MKSGKFTARSITEQYLQRMQEVDKQGPALNSVIEINPDALEIAESLDRERKKKARADRSRDSGSNQGQHRYRRQDDDDRRIPGAGRRSQTIQRCLRRPAIAQGRCSHPGEDELERVGQHPLQPLEQWMERARRADEKSLRPRPQRVRLQFRNGSGSIGKSGRGRNRHRDRWLDRLPFVREWAGRHQDHGWSGEPNRDHSYFSQPGRGRTHVQNGTRRRHHAGRIRPESIQRMPTPGTARENPLRTTPSFWTRTG